MMRLETLSAQIRTCTFPPAAPALEDELLLLLLGGGDGTGPPEKSGGMLDDDDDRELDERDELGELEEGADGGAGCELRTRLSRFANSSASEYFKV
jgi:hypothetical protein